MVIKRNNIKFNGDMMMPPRPLTEIGHHVSMNPTDLSTIGRQSPFRADLSVANVQSTSFQVKGGHDPLDMGQEGMQPMAQPIPV